LDGCNLHHLAQQCSDCGAFYMGREWTYQGNNITHNTFRHLTSIFSGLGTQALYLDDMGSSFYIADNLFDGVGAALELGGGRGNAFVRNRLNATSDKPVHFDNRGEGWAKAGCRPGGLPYDFLQYVPYAEPAPGPWARYPHLATILADDPCRPKYNLFADNVMCNGPKTLINQGAATIAGWGSTATNNTVQAEC
jgi:hypothetical protein